MGIVYFTNNKKLQKVSKAIYAYSNHGHQTKTSWVRLAWWPCLATWGNLFRIPFLSSNGEKTGTFFLFSSYTSSLLSPKKKYVTRIRIWNFSNILHFLFINVQYLAIFLGWIWILKWGVSMFLGAAEAPFLLKLMVGA